MQKIGTVFATVWGTSLAREHSCGCWANGEENEPLCEESGFAIGQCLTQGGKCHWGPGEVPECAKEASDFEKTQGVQTTQMNDMMFMQHVADMGHSYATVEEFTLRKAQFIRTHLSLEEINARPGMTQTVRHNMFSTWTEEEKGYSSNEKFTPIASRKGEESTLLLADPSAQNGDITNWKTTGHVNPVKNQYLNRDRNFLDCDASWAFSAVAAVESNNAIWGNGLMKLSEQQLLSCIYDGGENGCTNKGNKTYRDAYRYFCENADYKQLGLESRSQYLGSRTATRESCRQLETSKEGGQTQRMQELRGGDATNLKNAINMGVVSVQVDASSDLFRYYGSGIISSADCYTQKVHYSMNAIGYGQENNMQYYIVRGSWGTGWGEEGYARIAISTGAGTCGIQVDPILPQVV